MLTLMPSASRSRIAGSPSGVPGTLIIRFLRSTVAPQPLRLRDGGLRVGCEIGRNLDADKAVGAVRRVVRWAQHVGGVLDVLDRELLVDFADWPVVRLQHLRDGVVVFVGMSDRVLEDRGVRRDPTQAIVIDQLLEPALGNEAARQKIEPHGLALILKRFQRIHTSLFPAICCLGGLHHSTRDKAEFLHQILDWR